ncbi:MAG: hypothetical protein ABIQ64_03615 [Candidatus Saccharimonadales bacterium]
MKNQKIHDLSQTRLWKPVYGRFDYTIVSQRLDQLAKLDVNADALRASKDFIDAAFADYQRRSSPRKYGFVFAIPTRITRAEGCDTSEAQHFLPLVNYVPTEIAQIFLSEMPPCVLDEYYDANENIVGAIVFVPLMQDILSDIRPRFRAYLRVRRIIRLTSKYIHDQLQPDLVGLGATLPKITRFGADMAAHGLATTTGHGGTVYLIYKMYKELQEQDYNGETTGIIGAGSIGASSAALLLDRYKNIKVLIFDTRPHILRNVVKELNRKYGDRAEAALSNEDVIRSSSIIVSAITSTIKIKDEWDLRGKIIIDDSQPGSFSRDEVEAQGGKVVWVVGRGLDKLYKRKSAFRYGDNGLHTSSDIWGCEAELATIWHTKDFSRAIVHPVTPQAALSVGSLMDQVGIDRAEWQNAGVIVDMQNEKHER